LHPPNKCPRVCFFPESHHQQTSDSFFLIRIALCLDTAPGELARRHLTKLTSVCRFCDALVR
jgi:hypothetical protein